MSIDQYYGHYVFTEEKLKERVPSKVFEEFKQVQQGHLKLESDLADIIAMAMREWAISHGATHYTHWFLPLTEVTAEKHESFIGASSDATNLVMEFSGNHLRMGEPDASSFPSGGLRCTFEARGYTAWDLSSPVFIKKDSSVVTLYIPTIFISYHAEALDKKLPLLRSMDVISRATLRILPYFGVHATKVIPNVGAEQEYFLIDKEMAQARKDIHLTGKTLFGSLQGVASQLHPHYYAKIPTRVGAFMKEFNEELWRLGIPAKTQHNEVAPCQFEIAPLYEVSNIAVDHNQLLMECLEKIADRHGFKALLHEKPFAGMNGSGKHNNWSLSTDSGENLFDMGKTSLKRRQFLLFVSAVLVATDRYAGLLKASVSSAGNDLRLGGHEAPPSIISIFLGEEITGLFDSFKQGIPLVVENRERLAFQTEKVADIFKDLTDRNRTSPFAFTGNKFEFRMMPSSRSIATLNTVLNLAMAKVLDEFADQLESSENVEETIDYLINQSYQHHGRIIFNGDGYSPKWHLEAQKRGLANLSHAVVSIKEFIDEKSIDLFTHYGVLTAEELGARYQVHLEKYIHTISTDARLMVTMVETEILPASIAHLERLNRFSKEESINLFTSIKKWQKKPEEWVSELIDKIEQLDILLKSLDPLPLVEEVAMRYQSEVIALMREIRHLVDQLELKVERSLWPYPTYEEILL